MEQPAKRSLSLSVVIPAFNEARRLPPTLVDMIFFLEGRGEPYEIIVVNDGSTDTTSDVVKKIQKLCGKVRVIDQPRNFGKGFAVKTGVLASAGKLVLMADADGATPIEELARLEHAIEAGADIAIGSRALASKETAIHTSIHRRLFGRVFNACVNFLVVPGIADTQCGFKLFSRSAAHFLFGRLRSERFSFDVELLYIAQRAGMQITEVPINWNNIPESKINLVADSTRMFLDLLRFRYWHRDVDRKEWAAEH